jgi:hypothetical protein
VAIPGADTGFCVRGTKVGEGSGDRLRLPAGLCLGRGPRKLLGFEYLGSFSVKHFVNVMKCIKTHESSPKS